MRPVILKLLLLILMIMSLCMIMSCNSGDSDTQNANPVTPGNTVVPPAANNTDPSDPLNSDAIIIGHESTDLSMIPLQYLTEAKAELHIAYGPPHTEARLPQA